MPAARQRSSSPFMAFAVTATTGVRAVIVPLGLDRAQAARELVAVHARHVDVGEHRRIGPRQPGFERLDAVLGGVGRDAEQVELAHQHFLVHRMVVDHEHQRPLAGARDGAPRRPAPTRERCVAANSASFGGDVEIEPDMEGRAGARRALGRNVAAPSAARAGARSRGRARCRRSGAWWRSPPARTAGTAACALSSSMPMPVSATVRCTRVRPPPIGVVAAFTVTPAAAR